MNITIYYLSKKIIFQEQNQRTENQSFKNFDCLRKDDIKWEFERFVDNTNNDTLFFYTKNTEKAFDKFRKIFKYIYAAGGLIAKNDTYLFIYRLNRWDLPKGKLEMGESPEEAAIRECEEECGITKLTISKTLEPTYHIYPHKGKYALKKTFWYAMDTLHTKALIPQLEEKIEKVEFLTKTQIQDIVLANTYPAILDVIKVIG